MHRLFILLAVLTLATALPAAVPAAGADPICGSIQADGADCCPGTPSASDCQVTDCAGWSSALPIALPRAGHAPHRAAVPQTRLARLLAPPARAPDTAPPKSVA
jgi:hypothetical protein